MYKNKSIIIQAIPLVITAIFFIASFSMCKNTSNKKANEQTASVVIKKDTMRIRPLTNIKYERTEQRLKQGAYLTTGILQCFACHSQRNWNDPIAPIIEGTYGSGGTVLLKDSANLIIAPNITPDKETGAGTWTDDMLGRAIREGVGHDGRVLYWQMPSSTFRNLSDEELASVVVYLRSIPAVRHVVPPSKFPDDLRSEIRKSLQPITKPVAAPDLSDSLKRGRYLVRLGECVGCHTSHSEYSPGILGGGNYIDRFGRNVFSANITIDPAGISYGREAFIFVIRTGKGGTLSPVMPWISFKNMTDSDLNAIYTYLQTIPPSRHYVSNQKPFTKCEICGMEHGFGNRNKRERPQGIKSDPELYSKYAGTYLNEEDSSTYTVIKQGDTLIAMSPWTNGTKTEMIPQSELHFMAAGWPVGVSFIKNKNGDITGLAEDTDYGRIFKKIK